MLTQPMRSLRNLLGNQKVIPTIDNRSQLARALEMSPIRVIWLRHCNLFDFSGLLELANERDCAVYVSIDQINGVAPDAAGLHFLATRMHVTGIFSNNPGTLAIAKDVGLETVQRLFTLDSTGLKSTLVSVDSQYIDLLNISPALVIPYILTQTPLQLPFIGTGFIYTSQQVQIVLHAGASHDPNSGSSALFTLPMARGRRRRRGGEEGGT